MKKRFIDGSLSLIKKTRMISELEEKKLKYGLEGFYNLATKTIVMLLLAIYFNVVIEYFILIIIYSTLRLYGFGIHMKTSLQCWFTTLPIYIGGALLVKYTVFNSIVCQFAFVLGFVSFLLFSPADTPSRPLIHREKRIRAKILSLIIFGCYFVLFFYSDNSILKNIIVYAIFMESISINPITYVLFRTPFNSYKTYHKKMV